MPGQEVLGVGLAALQLGGRSGGPEDAVASSAEPVDHASHQRHFRADHGQLDAFGLHQRQQPVQVGDLDRHVAAAGLGGGARIARRNQHLGDTGGLGQLPGQGMFTAAGADDEDLQGSSRNKGEEKRDPARTGSL
ncbi:hypothetical protein D9M71_800690 [compost metagenome]